MSRFHLSICLCLVVTSCSDTNNNGSTGNINTKNSVNSTLDTNNAPPRYSEGVPISGVELGMGWDSIKGEVVPNICIDFSPIRSSGQDITLNMKEVSDKSEVMDSLKVSAEVSVKTMFAEGSAQASFAKESKASSTSTTLMLTAKVENGEIFVGPLESSGIPREAYPTIPKDTLSTTQKVKPSPEVSNPIPVRLTGWADKIKTDENKFLKSCGDYFVGSISSGAEMISTISFESISSKENKEITVALKGQYGAVSGSASAQENGQKALENTNLQISYIQVGGGPGLIPIDKDDIKIKLRELALEANNNPKFHTMELRSYKELPEFSDTNIKDRSNDSYEVVSDYYWFLTSYFNDIEDIFINPNKYSKRTGLTYDDLKKVQDVTLYIRKIIYKVMQAKNEDQELNDQLFTENFKQAFTDRISELSGGNEGIIAKLIALDKLSNLITTNPTSISNSDEWFNYFVDTLRKVVKYENPNILRLLLPLPAGPTDAHILDENNLRKEVIYWYLRKQSSRMCKLNPTDNECLSNDQLDELIDLVPEIRPLGTAGPMDPSIVALKSVVNDLCLQIPQAESDDKKLIGQHIIVDKCKPVLNTNEPENKEKNTGWLKGNKHGHISLSSIAKFDDLKVCAVKKLSEEKERLIFVDDKCDEMYYSEVGHMIFEKNGQYKNISENNPVVELCLELDISTNNNEATSYPPPSFEKCDKKSPYQRWELIKWEDRHRYLL